MLNRPVRTRFTMLREKLQDNNKTSTNRDDKENQVRQEQENQIKKPKSSRRAKEFEDFRRYNIWKRHVNQIISRDDPVQPCPVFRPEFEREESEEFANKCGDRNQVILISVNENSANSVDKRNIGTKIVESKNVMKAVKQDSSGSKKCDTGKIDEHPKRNIKLPEIYKI